MRSYILDKAGRRGSLIPRDRPVIREDERSVREDLVRRVAIMVAEWEQSEEQALAFAIRVVDLVELGLLEAAQQSAEDDGLDC